MFSKIKNIIIFAVIIGALILVYVFFFKNNTESNLTTSAPISGSPAVTSTSDVNSSVDTEFISILLSVRDIKINDAIFSDVAFTNLRDSSIILTPDNTEGRKNPFAMIGFDSTLTPSTSNPITSVVPAPITPPATSTLKTTTPATNSGSSQQTP